MISLFYLLYFVFFVIICLFYFTKYIYYIYLFFSCLNFYGYCHVYLYINNSSIDVFIIFKLYNSCAAIAVVKFEPGKSKRLACIWWLGRGTDDRAFAKKFKVLSSNFCSSLL